MDNTFNFGHFIPISTVDWHGRSASVLFFRGCQFDCPYCQNHAYLTGRDDTTVEELSSKISKAVPYISALVFSGGEPTMQPDALADLARYARSKSLDIGIETNGFAFDVIRTMVDEELLDKVFLDIKAPLDEPAHYAKVTGADEDMGARTVRAAAGTLTMCLDAEIEVEVRTTVFKGLAGAEQVLNIMSYLDITTSGNLTYAIQQGIPENTRSLKDAGIFHRDELMKMARAMKPDKIKHIRIRTQEQGDELIL
ncbi:MAG: anaerobic ribonucleoside-triphosphate reductase activating protein [ANME-2 cluster archaeon]|nr:anaerobic ribonucleoside-triphosphate reductase activating protein [ANME-2 cluster archaeon]